MTETKRFILGALAATTLVIPAAASAREPRSLSCSVSVDYELNRVLRSAYSKDFVVTEDTPFSDDFSTAVRFRFLDASASLDADGKTMIVALSYYNDVGVFEAVDFRTELRITDDKLPATTSATHSYWSSVGIAGDHTTSWLLTCSIVKG